MSGTPDHLQAITVLENGARAVYHFSGVATFGQTATIALFGSKGVLHYDLATDRIRGAAQSGRRVAARFDELDEIPIPPDKAMGWRLKKSSCRRSVSNAVQFTDFATGWRTWNSPKRRPRRVSTGVAVELPLLDLAD